MKMEWISGLERIMTHKIKVQFELKKHEIVPPEEDRIKIGGIRDGIKNR
jgi:hypothetical protein